MQIDCPFCGKRNSSEFVNKGDASVSRPLSVDETAFFEFVYLRDNLSGPMKEFWFHAAGCHAWLIVARDAVSHEIIGVEVAKSAMLARKRGAP
jgi:methylglutamate dehydrogenase subunit B